MSVHATFKGGPLDGKDKRLARAYPGLRVWAHRQTQGIVEIGLLSDPPRQADLWSPTEYHRTDVGLGYVTYEAT